MATLRVKAPDGKTLVVAVPTGTDPSQYDGMASAALAHYQETSANYWREKGDYPAAGEEKPVEQKMAENAVQAGNAAGMAYGLPGMVKGAVGAGLKGLGAVTEGLSNGAEGLGNWFGSRVLQASRSTLPEVATNADKMVSDATEYAMNSHPEVKAAIRGINAPAVAADATGTDMVPFEPGKDVVPSESTVKAIGNGEGDSLPTAPNAAVADGVTGANTADDPILSMSNMTTKSQLAATNEQLGSVGKGIEDVLNSLNESGNKYDPDSTIELLNGMYKRNASGTIIPVGRSSAQALFNQAVTDAINTVKAEAMDDQGAIQSVGWDTANRIKGALQNLGKFGDKGEAEDYIYQTAARAVRDSIDDQAQQVLSAQGKDVSQFQTLRNAYSKLKSVQNFINNKRIGELGAKNQLPVLRTSMGMGLGVLGTAMGGPGLGALAATAPAAEWGMREFGPLMAARALKTASGLPAAASSTGAGLMATSGGALNAARGVAAGLALDINEAD